MTDITHLIQSGSAHVWLYIPVAVLLGALHGLEPGHSKTMMAAFIIAIRGTISQAILLGLSAAVSHSLIIWVLAALALHYGSRWDAETIEPYLQIVSAVLIFGLALWMYRRTRSEVADAAAHGHGHAHDDPHEHAHGDHGHDHSEVHSHGPPAEPEAASALILPPGYTPVPAQASGVVRGAHGGNMLYTGHGWLEISVFEDGVPPRFRVYPCKATGAPLPLPRDTKITIETARLDGSIQRFLFEAKSDFWEATAELPEPHEFMATITMSHGDHDHTYRMQFTEDHHHHGTVAKEVVEKDDVFQDAHERAHAQDITKRFAGRTVTTPQIILFGITGGLMPCPAAFTILLVCLQLKRATLGFAIVGAFSFGLALTMVTVGAVAAWSVQRAQKRFSGFGEAMRKAPYVSCVLLTLLASYMAFSGWQGLQAQRPMKAPTSPSSKVDG